MGSFLDLFQPCQCGRGAAPAHWAEFDVIQVWGCRFKVFNFADLNLADPLWLADRLRVLPALCPRIRSYLFTEIVSHF
jgi:hypothetical protein